VNAARLPAGFLSAALVVASASSAGASGERVQVSTETAKTGVTVGVMLRGWAPGTVLVGVCGDAAHRGSQDCALESDVAVAVRRNEPAAANLVITAPPVPCPCVVRAATPAGDIVKVVPLAIAGVPNGPVQSEPAAASTAVDVAAHVESASSWPAMFGGSAHKTLVVTLDNRGDVTVTGLRIAGHVGRRGDGGTPFPATNVRALAPGDREVVRVDIDLGAPAYGRYTVAGAVYGLATPASFRATTTNDPWLLQLLAVVVLLAWAQALRARHRKLDAIALSTDDRTA